MHRPARLLCLALAASAASACATAPDPAVHAFGDSRSVTPDEVAARSKGEPERAALRAALARLQPEADAIAADVSRPELDRAIEISALIDRIPDETGAMWAVMEEIIRIACRDGGLTPEETDRELRRNHRRFISDLEDKLQSKLYPPAPDINAPVPGFERPANAIRDLAQPTYVAAEVPATAPAP